MRIVSIKKAAEAMGLRLAQTTLLGDRLLCVDDAGRLFQFAKTRWVRMEPVQSVAKHARRLIRCAGPRGREV